MNESISCICVSNYVELIDVTVSKAGIHRSVSTNKPVLRSEGQTTQVQYFIL